jgi:DNA-binding Lrp family transcriptional regulator
MNIDNTDKKLLNLLQKDFPLVKNPFSVLANEISITEQELLQRIENLKTRGLIREIGPVLDSRKLGYQSTLVAMRIQEKSLEKVAQIINKHPGVSHNYARDHYFNFWFTLAIPNNTNMQDEIQKLSSLVKSEATLNLPALQVFKLRAYFNFAGDSQSEAGEMKWDTPYPISDKKVCDNVASLLLLERAIINELQQDVPLVKNPFDAMAEHLNVTVDEFLEQCHLLKKRGVIRHFGALIRHYNAGFSANAMVCWAVPSSSVKIIGRKMASFPEVSHCYERKTAPNWNYNLFTMIHDKTRESLKKTVEKILLETGIDEYAILFTVKEFKKERIKLTVHLVSLRGAGATKTQANLGDKKENGYEISSASSLPCNDKKKGYNDFLLPNFPRCYG